MEDLEKTEGDYENPVFDDGKDGDSKLSVVDVHGVSYIATEFSESSAVEDIGHLPGVEEGSDPRITSNTNKSETLVEIAVGPQHFDLLKLVGQGAFGKVILVQNKINKELYAMKVISKKLLKKKNNISYMKSERDILTKVNHPFVVSLSFAFQSSKKLFLVMDFLAGGELFYHLRKRGLIPEADVRFYVGEMILALEFLHDLNVIHRDLKPENVLLRSSGHICITDFGLAKDLSKGGGTIGGRSGDEEDDGNHVRTLCGTSEYMAPEMLSRNGYSKAVDWWSLGALCYEMLVGKAPFTAKNEKDLYKKILTEKFLSPPFLTPNTHSLLKGLLEKDAKKRLGAAKSTMFTIGGVTQLKNHPFFSGIDWNALLAGKIPPPIDLSVSSRPFPSSTPPLPDDKPGTPRRAEDRSPSIIDATQKPPFDKEGKEDFDWTDFTSHFHVEFTSQHISQSMIEDTLSCASPASQRSRANSLGDSVVGGSEDLEDLEDVETYAGFEYSGTPIRCTEAMAREIERDVTQKLTKLAKKRHMKARREEEKGGKAVLEAARRKEQKEKEEALRVRQKAEKDAAVTEFARQEKLASDRKKLAQLRDIWRQYNEEVDKIAKKSKAMRKKLRDIEELEEKLAKANGAVKPTKEQTGKLNRKQELEDGIAELEEEQLKLLSTAPSAIPEELIAIEQTTAELKSQGSGIVDSSNVKAFPSSQLDEARISSPVAVNTPSTSTNASLTYPNAVSSASGVWARAASLPATPSPLMSRKNSSTAPPPIPESADFPETQTQSGDTPKTQTESSSKKNAVDEWEVVIQSAKKKKGRPV